MTKKPDYSKFRHRLMWITPAMATKFLQKNDINRAFRDDTAKLYAKDIDDGKWLLTHQAIAFDVNGQLVDGQHRLWGIVIANKAVRMLVVTGLPVSVADKPNETTIFDVIDGGLPRSKAMRLHKGHGMKNAALLAAAASVIRDICLGMPDRRRASVHQILGVLAIYRTDIEAIADKIQSKSDRSSSILGPLAFARHGDQQLGDEFAEIYYSQIGLTRGHPALALRRWAENHKSNAGTERLHTSLAVASALRTFKQKRSVTRGNVSTEAMDWLRKMQAADVQKVCNLFEQVPQADERILRTKKSIKKAKEAEEERDVSEE